MKYKLLLISLLLILQVSCTKTIPSKIENQYEGIDKNNFSLELPEWINETFYYLENHAIYRNSINWAYERKIIFELYQIEQNGREVFNAIQTLIQKSGSKHSFLVDQSFVEQVNNYHETVDRETINQISFQLVNDVIGYIKISSYYSDNKDLDQELNQKISNSIREAEKHNVQGIIIDLSENEGGNMYPPLIALTSILENGDLGYFYDPMDQSRVAWAHENGSIKIRDNHENYASFMNQSYFMSSLRDIPKAILISQKTASSGEFILLSLSSQNNTRVFGEKTAGYSTGNEIFKLSNGSKLILTTTLAMDTKGNIYKDFIYPDVITTDWNSAKSEAMKWLLNLSS